MSGTQPPDAEPTLAELAAMEHIRRVYHRYCDALDYKAFEGLADVFAEDCEVDYTDILPGLVVSGSAAVVGSARAMLGSHSAVDRTHHNVGNFRIAIQDETAEAKVRFHAVHSGAGALRGQTFLCWGDYHDQLEKRDGQWRIVHRAYLGFITQGNPEIGGYSAG